MTAQLCEICQKRPACAKPVDRHVCCLCPLTDEELAALPDRTEEIRAALKKAGEEYRRMPRYKPRGRW